MADPRNSNRRSGAGVTAEDFARAYAAQPSHTQHAQPHFSAHRQYFGDSDEEEIAEPADSSAKKGSDGDRSHELRRDEMQYRTALKTAFELGHKAGLMQRNEIPPCSACERRKERNRIAAQASRMEKRRLERGVSSDSSVETAEPSNGRHEHTEHTERAERRQTEGGERAKRRRPTAGAAPPPFFQATEIAPAEPARAAPTFYAVAAEEEEEELGDEIAPPPF